MIADIRISQEIFAIDVLFTALQIFFGASSEACDCYSYMETTL